MLDNKVVIVSGIGPGSFAPIEHANLADWRRSVYVNGGEFMPV